MGGRAGVLVGHVLVLGADLLDRDRLSRLDPLLYERKSDLENDNHLGQQFLPVQDPGGGVRRTS